MTLRSCLLHALLAVLVLPSMAYAAPIPNTTSHSPPATGCVADAPVGIVTPYAYPAEFDLCLFGGNQIEEMVRTFRLARAAERRQRHLARERERRELEARRRARRRAEATRSAKYVSESQAKVPKVAPEPVKAVIEAANAIATAPYVWGGGHGSFESTGYDCSGAVSYALHGGDLISSPTDSSGLEGWGEAGSGRWITVYANAGHAWMEVAGLAFDTAGGGGPRWYPSPVSSTEGYVARHPTRRP